MSRGDWSVGPGRAAGGQDGFAVLPTGASRFAAAAALAVLVGFVTLAFRFFCRGGAIRVENPLAFWPKVLPGRLVTPVLPFFNLAI